MDNVGGSNTYGHVSVYNKWTSTTVSHRSISQEDIAQKNINTK